MTDWFRDWQNPEHVRRFDGRAELDDRNLVRNYDAFNDVRLLSQCLQPGRALNLLEVGCATGEFSRYLRLTRPAVRYTGVDVSQPALACARQKYPNAAFYRIDPSQGLASGLSALKLPQPEVLYAKDVVQHQAKPFDFVTDMVQAASESVIFRCRTRDVGKTELDPDRSCQYHYDGWMPYMVLNIQELVDRILGQLPGCEIVVLRHHMVLGGEHQRFLPKDLYLKEAGTAETAVGVLKTSAAGGRVRIEDRDDETPRYTWSYRLRHLARRLAATAPVDAPTSASSGPRGDRQPEPAEPRSASR